MKIINVGCGSNPIYSSIKIDNSPTVKLANHTFLVKILKSFHILNKQKLSFIDSARKSNIKYGTASRLKFADNSIDVVYTSHMVEHLYESDFDAFIAEAYRVLVPGGILRIAIPDLKIGVEH